MKSQEYKRLKQELREARIKLARAERQAKAEPTEWELKRRLLAWMHNKRCPLCGKREPLECARGTTEEPGDLLPLCWWCHPLFEWMRTPAADMFKEKIRRVLNRRQKLRLYSGDGSERLRVTKEEVGEVMNRYSAHLDSRLEAMEIEFQAWMDDQQIWFGDFLMRFAEFDQEVAPLESLRDAWDREYQAVRVEFGGKTRRQVRAEEHLDWEEKKQNIKPDEEVLNQPGVGSDARPREFGLDALQEKDNHEQRDVWGDERIAA